MQLMRSTRVLNIIILVIYHIKAAKILRKQEEDPFSNDPLYSRYAKSCDIINSTESDYTFKPNNTLCDLENKYLMQPGHTMISVNEDNTSAEDRFSSDEFKPIESLNSYEFEVLMYRMELGKMAESIGLGGGPPIKSLNSQFVDDTDPSDDFSSTATAPALTERRNSPSSLGSMTTEDADQSKDHIYSVGQLSIPERRDSLKSFDSMIVEDTGSESESV